MEQKNIKKNLAKTEKSEKFFLEGGNMPSYNSSVAPQNTSNDGNVKVSFLKWTKLSPKEKAEEERKREAFVDLMAILIKKYGYKVLKK